MPQPGLDHVRRRRLVNAELLLEEPLGSADRVVALVVGPNDERPVHTRPLIHSECNWRRRGEYAMCPLALPVRWCDSFRRHFRLMAAIKKCSLPKI